MMNINEYGYYNMVDIIKPCEKGRFQIKHYTATPEQVLEHKAHWDIPEVIESIISVFEEMLGNHENPDAGMEERERELAEAIEENALVERVTSTLTTLEGLEGKDD